MSSLKNIAILCSHLLYKRGVVLGPLEYYQNVLESVLCFISSKKDSFSYNIDLQHDNFFAIKDSNFSAILKAIEIIVFNENTNTLSISLINSKQVRELCAYEILTYTPEVSLGCHMRHELICRGGIRLHKNSDETFYSVCRNLANTQQVKNSVITMGGSKGVFVDLAKNSSQAYECFISGLLQVMLFTSNKLFIAADIGTSSYSQKAIDCALAYRYPMANLFASGVKGGLNHQELGITSRGALVILKRHSERCNFDKSIFQVIGIGSMRGDVFSNFFARAKDYDLNLKLIAAISSTHVYLNPFMSSVEQARLSTSNLGWQELPATSGCIFSRSQETCVIPENIASFFKIKRTISVSKLIKSLLEYPVDVLFNGGAGTWVSNNPTSSQIRPQDLKASFLIEGGNLGIEQDARKHIGSSFYGDFVDNSAGVRLSDYEIQYKHYFAKYEFNGDFSMANLCVRCMKDILANRVLEDIREDISSIDLLEDMTSSHKEEIKKCLLRQAAKHNNLQQLVSYTNLETTSSLYNGVLLALRNHFIEQGLHDTDLSCLRDYYSDMYDKHLPTSVTFAMKTDDLIIRASARQKSLKLAKSISLNPNLLQEYCIG